MSETPRGPVIEVPPQPAIYTILIIIAILVLGAAVGVVCWKLMGAGGYGLEFKDLFEPLKRIAP